MEAMAKPRVPRRFPWIADTIADDDGSTDSGPLAPTLRGEFRSGAARGLTYRANYESVRDSFPVAPDVSVPPDAYWFHEAEVEYRAGRRCGGS
jgi:hypothetical protein